MTKLTVLEKATEKDYEYYVYECVLDGVGAGQYKKKRIHARNTKIRSRLNQRYEIDGKIISRTEAELLILDFNHHRQEKGWSELQILL